MCEDKGAWKTDWIGVQNPCDQKEQPAVRGKVAEYRVSELTGQAGANAAKKEEQGMEQQLQRQHEKERARQLEGVLASSLSHQQRMLKLTQANREMQEKNKAMKGKSTQTAENWWTPARRKASSKQKGWEALEGKHGKTAGLVEWNQNMQSATQGERTQTPTSDITATGSAPQEISNL